MSLQSPCSIFVVLAVMIEANCNWADNFVIFFPPRVFISTCSFPLNIFSFHPHLWRWNVTIFLCINTPWAAGHNPPLQEARFQGEPWCASLGSERSTAPWRPPAYASKWLKWCGLIPFFSKEEINFQKLAWGTVIPVFVWDKPLSLCSATPLSLEH